MKKTLAVVGLMLILGLAFAAPALAGKPAPNLVGAQVVPWNLSAAAMPVPPYGSVDIPGSDSASKLIVNQPNGNTQATITGVMGGLTPLTTYTVFLSNGYTPYKDLGWDVTGSYTIDLTLDAAHYTEYLVLAWDATNGVTGTYVALDAAGTVSRWDIDSGAVVGDQLTLHAYFDTNPSMEADFAAKIAADGSLYDGTWADVAPGTRSGTWTSTVGLATKITSGSTRWPGMFGALQPFTFVTNQVGAASWHVNLKNADFPGAGTYPLSVWINSGGGTMLISDTFTVVK